MNVTQKKSVQELWGFLRDKILCWVCCSGHVLCPGSRRCCCTLGHTVPSDGVGSQTAVSFCSTCSTKISVGFIPLTL